MSSIKFGKNGWDEKCIFVKQEDTDMVISIRIDNNLLCVEILDDRYEIEEGDSFLFNSEEIVEPYRVDVDDSELTGGD